MKYCSEVSTAFHSLEGSVRLFSSGVETEAGGDVDAQADARPSESEQVGLLPDADVALRPRRPALPGTRAQGRNLLRSAATGDAHSVA